jgi:pyruvate/2-oxoglutarate dehydrogenase complex dihydrolipoamide dehydrogenase (E3) component
MKSEVNIDMIKEINPDVVIIATGSIPYKPPIDGINLPIVATVPEIFNGVKTVMKDVIIIGGGATGCEVALELSERGISVTVVEQLPNIGTQIEAITKKIILEKLRKNSVRILTEHRLLKISKKGAYVIDKNGNHVFLKGDKVIIAVGNRPNNSLFEKVKQIEKEVYQIGDCLEVRSAKEAIYEGAYIGISI